MRAAGWLAAGLLIAATADAQAPGPPMSGVASDPAFQALQARVAALGDPVIKLILGANNHIMGATAAGNSSDPGAVPLSGDVAGTNVATVAPSLKPAYTTVAVVSGGTVQLPSGFTYYDLSGTGTVALATIRLPANPVDRQLVRLIVLNTLAITALTVQDASGNAIGSTLALPLLGAAQYQFQATQWVRSGS